jgi:hypothetical protein
LGINDPRVVCYRTSFRGTISVIGGVEETADRVKVVFIVTDDPLVGVKLATGP